MKKILLPLLLLIPLCAARSQEDSLGTYGVIDTVIVSGNEKTEPYVILDEMTLKPGSVATAQAIEFDRNRIYSLGLFTRVDIFYDSLEGKRFLYVEVRERWYLIPIPIFGFRDGDPKKPFYGFGLLHYNVRGRNQKLFASVTFGYNPALALSFSDPLLDSEHNLFYGVNVSLARVRNRSAIESGITGDFDEHHFGVDATLGKRFSLYETAGLKVGYRSVRIDEYRPGRTASPDGRDKFVFAEASYTYDSRDLREYASRGTYFRFFSAKLGFGESDVDFSRFGADFRRYIPMPLNLTLAGRVHGSVVAGGLIPTYERVYFGFGERIRGHFKTVYEGENQFGSALELRYPLLKARTITFTAIPLPAEFAVWRFGISLALFADAGVTWFRGERVGLRSLASGYGAGLHFLLPYSIVVRTEYAFNEPRRGQFIVDFRTSF